MRIVLSVVIFLTCFAGYSQTDTFDIYINTGQHQLVDSSFVPVKAFNKTSTLSFDAQLFKFTMNKDVVLHFINNDTVNHQVEISDYGISTTINASSEDYELFPANLQGTFSMFSKSLVSSHDYLGLSAMIVVGNTTNAFYWNIKDLQSSFNQSIASGGSVDFGNYDPNYFLINGKSNPDIGLDTLAKIVGNVGDTITLHILNSGNSVHSLHFHGYHFRVLYASKFPERKNWIKDTYGMYSKEIVVLELVPDKPGEYPVHDHNLVATTANNIYPNGMFTTIVIAE